MNSINDVRRVLSVLVVSQCLLLGWLSKAAAAEEAKWRVIKQGDNRLMLYVADTDEATDAIGALSFECTAGSGFVFVSKEIQDKSERAAIAKLVLNDSYPTVELNPGPQTSALEAITSSDISGWGYRFQVSADASAFDAFRKTGSFTFKISGTPIQYGIKAGLDKIAEFLSACRMPSDRPKAAR